MRDLFTYIIVIIGGVILYCILAQNNAHAAHERVLKTFSDIDVVLIQRNDQIKNQLNFLMGALKQESELMILISKYRSGISDYNNMSINEKVDFNSNLGYFVTHGLRNNEAYPELSNVHTTIPIIIKEWSKVEAEITTKRLAYNRSVTRFNIGLKQFPANIFYRKARLLGSENGEITPFLLIKATDVEKEPVKVEKDWYK